MNVIADQAKIYSILEECRQLPGIFTKDAFFVFEKDELLFLGCYLKNSNKFYLFSEDIHVSIESTMNEIKKIIPELENYFPEILDEFIKHKENRRSNDQFFDAH